MGHNDITEEVESGYKEFLQTLIDMGHLEGSALGITKLVIDKGEDALSEKGHYVFKTEVLEGEYYQERCKQCSEKLEWSEMYEAVTGRGLCGYCEYKSEKDD